MQHQYILLNLICIVFLQAHQQQMVQQMPQTPGSQSSNQSLSQADFDALGFSLDLGNGIIYCFNP